MKIAVNTRWLLANKMEGTGWFTHHLLKRIVANNPDVEFIFFFDRKFNKRFMYGDNVKGVVIPPPARHPFLWHLWNDWAIPIALKQYKPDLYFSTDGFLPSFKKGPTKPKCKMLNTIHDLNFVHFPDLVSNAVGKHYRLYIKKSAKIADRLVTVSQYSKNDIVKTYDVPEDNIDVVYNASENFYPVSEEEQNSFRQKLTNGAPYFVFVGALNPRKNLHRIFKAFDELTSNTKLLIVGEKMRWDQRIEEAYGNMKNKDKVVFSGRLHGEELNKAYGASLALIFPSLYEGFGIPILEALQSGTSVITASNSSMPEVAGEAALLVDADNIADITNAMQRMESDELLKKHLAEKAPQQLAKFDWDKSADTLWQTMLNTINS